MKVGRQFKEKYNFCDFHMLSVKLWPEIGGKFDFCTVDIGQGFANLATCSFYICFLSFHMFSVERWAEVATPWRPFATQPELRRSYKLRVGQFLFLGERNTKLKTSGDEDML